MERVIFLHIGRNKAGSTTLQEVFARLSPDFRAAGVRYINFGHLADSDPSIEGFATMTPVAALARATGDRLLISNEFMSAWPDAYTWSVAEALKGLDVKILVYLRDYTQWLPSLYAQNVKSGDEVRDFDVFVDDPPQAISAWPMLQTWAAAFGWSRLRIQALDPQALFGGDIVSDAFSALGLPSHGAGRTGAYRSNESAGWMAIEMIRAARGFFTDEQWGQQVSAVERLAALLPASPPPGDPGAGYLDPEHSARLADLYDQDIARIAKQTGRSLPAARRITLASRARAPSWGDVPAETVAAWAHRQPMASPLAKYLLAEHQRRQSQPHAGLTGHKL